MRILVISNFYPPAHFGGYELECAGVVEHLRARHEVAVLSSRHDRERVPAESGIWRALPYGSYRKRDSLRAPVWALSAARTTRRVLDEFRPDLIFVWNGSRIPQVALRLAEGHGVPVAYRVCEHWFGGIYRDDTFLRHLLPGDRGLRRVWGLLMRAVNRHPALRIELSTPVRAAVSWVTDVIRDMTPRPPTLDPALERTLFPGLEIPESPRRHPEGRPKVLFAGRLADTKAPDVAIRALGLLRERHGIDAELLLAGAYDDPSYERTLHALVAELGLGEHVQFLGRLERSALEDLYARVHVGVVPSRWQEPGALALSETAAAAVPVVAARSGGMPELLREGEHALFFEIDDVDACAAALAEVLEHPEDTAARVERARARVKGQSIDRYYEETDRFVADAVAAITGRPAGEPPLSPAGAGLSPG